MPRSEISLAMPRWASGVALLWLAACGAASGVHGDGASTHPRAAVGTEAERAGLIYVLPVEGAQDPARLVLADAIVAALVDAGRPAILSEQTNPSGASIVGRIGDIEQHGDLLWVNVIWQLRAPYGTPVAQVRQQLAVDEAMWRRGGAEVVNLVVADAAPRIAEIIETHVGPTEAAMRPPPAAPASLPKSPMPAPMPQASIATPTPSGGEIATASSAPAKAVPAKPTPSEAVEPEQSLLEQLSPNMDAATRRPDDARPRKPASVTTIQWGRPAFLINPVSGAPGNGNESLTAALRSALRARDITISSDPRQAGFVISGQVKLTPPVNDRQLASITWVVNTITGEEVGRAVQENNVVAGTLDGEWGRVAEIVAGAAVKGIQELFGASENRVAGEDALPDIPNIELRQEPGRAPPPPTN